MKRVFERVSFFVSLLAVSVGASSAFAQEKAPGRSLVAVYQVAAGKHLDFLKWMVKQEAIAKEAGAPATQWYMHQDGGSWDFVSITPQLEPLKAAEAEKKVEALSKQKGVSTGLKSSFEFRQFMGTHTDTYAVGPVTADELVKMAEK